MDMMEQLSRIGIVPVIAINDAADAVPLAQALIDGGLPCAEVTFRTAAAADAIKNMTEAFPDMVVGAGTVLTVETAERAIDLGAKFIVMPGFSTKVVEFCLKRGVSVLPGCVTPTEIMMAMDYGLDAVKFFPIFEMGGTKTLAQLNGPFPNVKFVVTGSLTSENYLPLVDYPGTLAAGGDWMFQDHDALKNRDFEQIARNMRESVCQVQDMRNAKTRH